MRQKYIVVKDTEKNKIILQEYAELDKDDMSLLCEETYNADAFESAFETSRTALISAIRTRNMYPPSGYTEQIVDGVIALLNSDEEQTSVEILFSDADLLKAEREELEAMEEESTDIEDLLEDTDNLEDEFGEDDTISNIGSNSSIKIADDESLDIEDEG